MAIIRSDSDRQQFITKLNKVKLVDGEGKATPWQCDAKPYVKNRSSSQNRLLYKWYAELGKQSGNGADYERNYCKFTFGCIILMPDSDFQAFYSHLVCNLTYEVAIESMAFISVTSLFNVKQFTEYLNKIEAYAVARGYYLTKPDEYEEAMGK